MANQQLIMTSSVSQQENGPGWLDYIQMSRPGFYLITVWCYAAGLQGEGQRLLLSEWSMAAWIGLIYCTFPLNLLLYAWNDLDDEQVDKLNPRKGPYLLGQNGMQNDKVERIFSNALALNLMFMSYFVSVGGMMWITGWFLMSCLTNFVYNNFPKWRAGPMPFDFIGPLGYILVIPFAARINQLPSPNISTLLFHAAMVARSQLWGQIIDLGCDEKCNRKTTAVTLGVVKARMLLTFLNLCELFVAYFYINDIYVTSFSVLSVCVALIELFLYPPESPSIYLAAMTGMLLTPAGGLLLIHISSNHVF